MRHIVSSNLSLLLIKGDRFSALLYKSLISLVTSFWKTYHVKMAWNLNNIIIFSIRFLWKKEYLGLENLKGGSEQWITKF
jgi:hypothetical protein